MKSPRNQFRQSKPSWKRQHQHQRIFRPSTATPITQSIEKCWQKWKWSYHIINQLPSSRNQPSIRRSSSGRKKKKKMLHEEKWNQSKEATSKSPHQSENEGAPTHQHNQLHRRREMADHHQSLEIMSALISHRHRNVLHHHQCNRRNLYPHIPLIFPRYFTSSAPVIETEMLQKSHRQ